MTMIPKAEWGPGPWADEPDRKEWRHAGMPCLIRRSPGVTGALCGYVAVPPGHPAHGRDYDDVDVDVHGGLTFASPCDGAEGEGICHVPRPGEPGDVWWLGYDCGHAFDLCPAMRAYVRSAGLSHPDFSGRPDVYRDIAYVTAETERLAEQLAAMA